MKKLTHIFGAKVAAASIFGVSVFCSFLCFSWGLGAYLLGFYAVPASVSFSSFLSDSGLELYLTQEGEYYLSFIESIYRFRWWAVVLLAVGLAAAIASFVFLMCAAGHRADSPQPVLGYLDHVPLDLTLALILAVSLLLNIFITIPFLDELQYMAPYVDDMAITAVVLGLVFTVCLLLALYFCCSLAARVKVGKWWRGTLIYLIGRLLWRCIRAVCRFTARLVRSISIAWRAAFTVSAFLLLSFLLSIWAMEDGLALLLLIVLYAFALFAAILAAAQIKQLKKAGEKLASGDFEYKTNTSHMFWDFKSHGENLNSIAQGMGFAVDQRMRSERLKTELITNVSHDIKTPLTNIVSYVDLLRDAQDQETREKYLEVLSRQAQRLKKLTVDLVEASKASTGNLPVELVPTNTTELINQAVAEYDQRFRDTGLEPVFQPPQEPAIVMADGRHLWRVLDNLLNNALKYALPGTRVYLDVFASTTTGEAVISVKNISRDQLNVSAQELMERFVRGDPSRHTEGSGLGLSIAKSLTELMGGTFDLNVDGDLFKAVITLKLS